MLKTMSETLRIGLVVSDMFVPGCPLAYLNEGFAAQTGKCDSMHESMLYSRIISVLLAFDGRTVGRCHQALVTPACSANKPHV